MNERRIESARQLTQWLADNEYFPDLYVLRMDPRPRTDGTPLMPTITIEVATQVDGGFEAGEMRTMKVLNIRAEGVESFWIADPRGFDAEFCSETGIVQLESERCGIQLTVPAPVQLVCETLTATELPLRREVIQPWINDSELAARIASAPLPSPSNWVAMLEGKGVSAVWHAYQTAPAAAGQVPADYSGWFLQEPERIALGSEGVLIFNASSRPGGFVVHLQNHDPDGLRLWTALRSIVAEYSDLEVRTGTCRLTGTQWRQYLRDGFVG